MGGGRGEQGAGAPVRVAVADALSCEAQGGFGDIVHSVPVHHAGCVQRLRERELLVGVADAVSPRKDALLHERVPLGVDDAPLRNADGQCRGEFPFPKADE